MKSATRQRPVLDQQLALGAYLDALLGESARPAPPESGPVTSPAHAAAAELAAAEPPVYDGVPDWAGSRFQALLFEVAGLTLAVPLVKLKGVVSCAAQLTPMPGHSPLFLGILPYQGLQSRVVDTARFVLPADRAALLADDAGERSRNLVMIDEGRWALAASSIGDVVELDRSDVKWRSAAGRRPWLAGTVIEKMCALLDIDHLIGELAGGVG